MAFRDEIRADGGLPTHFPFDQGVLSQHLPVKGNVISYAPWWVSETSGEHLGNRGSFVFSESARPELLASKFRVALNLLTDPLLPLVTPLPASRVPAPVWTRQPTAPGFSPKQHELFEPETAKMSWPELDPALSSPRQVTKARGQGQPKRGARRSSMKSMKKALDFTFTVVFTGYDHEKHAEFELVPRLIGKRGCNMLPIQNIGAAARVCGRGSGYKEVHTADGQTIEKDETLQLAVACRTSDMHDAALRLVQPLLNDLSHHFRRFCRKKGLECPDLYILAAKQAKSRPEEALNCAVMPALVKERDGAPCLPCLDSGSIAGRRESCRLQMADIAELRHELSRVVL